ncbi:hypothetical protein BN1723_016009, partial [Verticillium longisporum]
MLSGRSSKQLWNLYHNIRSARHRIFALPTSRGRQFASVASGLRPFDVVVVGGGHAGTEACAAAARAGAKTALVTPKIDNLGTCSCNPSFGGIGKGVIIRELDALDGLAGRVIDKAGIHFQTLNRRKGPAVWGPRAQIDRDLYKKHMREELEGHPNLSIIVGSVSDVVLCSQEDPTTGAHSRITGVKLDSGEILPTTQVIITTGTFLSAMVHHLLGINNGRVDLNDVPDIRPELKEIVLSQDQDPFFKKNMYMNFGDLGGNIKDYVGQYQSKTQNNANIESISDMKRFIEEYPEFRKLSGNVSKHVTLVSELSRRVGAENLLEVSELEQSLACSDNHATDLKV